MVRDTLTIDRPEQLKALGHSLRLRVLEELATEEQPLTNRELAQRLGVDPGHLHFHVRMLQRAGLIELVDSEGKREKPYRVAARTIRVAPELTSAGLSGDLHAAFLEEAQQGFVKWGPKGEFRGAQVTVKLPVEKARELLREFAQRLEDEEDDDAETLVFTTVFHPPAHS